MEFDNNIKFQQVSCKNSLLNKTLDYKYCGWMKEIKKQNFPKLNNISLHSYNDDSLLIVSPQNNKLTFYLYLFTKQNFEELASFNTEEYFHTDSEFIHPTTFFINSKLVYLFKNSTPEDDEHVFIFDVQFKKIYSIKDDESRPSTFRINYSAVLYDIKIYIFGGLNMLLEPLNILETYNLTTYKWEAIQTKGKAPTPRHSHSSCISGSNLFIIGGTKSRDFFSKELSHFDDVYMLNLINFTWTPIKTFGDCPKSLAYNCTFYRPDKYIVCLWCDKDKENFDTHVSKLDLEKFEWSDIIPTGKEPEFRFNAGTCLDQKTNLGYIFGGFYHSQNENLAQGIELDCLLFSETRQIFENNDMFNVKKVMNHTTENTPNVNTPENINITINTNDSIISS